MGESQSPEGWQYWVMASAGSDVVPIVWAKLKPPILRQDSVDRAELVDRLTALEEPALTALVAPAGYGKTTAALQLVRRLGKPLAWLSLEPLDDDPLRFWTYVTAAIETAGVGGLGAVYELLANGEDSLGDAIGLLRGLIESANQDVVLVLDDVQVIEDEAIHQRLSELVRGRPSNLQLVCLSRADLPLPVGRLRSNNQLTEARVDDLAFRRAELVAVLDSTFGLAPLSDDNVDALLARTEGWPVGVSLAGLGLANNAEIEDVDSYVARFSGDRRHLAEYLATEALSELDDDLRAFVLVTSVVSILVPALCDELTGQPGSLGRLRQLVRDNVFTAALDENETLFRYHPLFRELLESMLEAEHAEMVCSVHARASVWFEQEGDIDAAIMHAIASGDLDRPVSLIKRSWLVFTRSGRLERLERWVAALGDAATEDTEVSLMMSWALLNVRRYDDMPRWTSAALAAATSDVERAMCGLETAVVQAHVARHRGDAGRSLSHARTGHAAAENALAELGDDRSERLVAVSATALVTLGVAAYWAGDLEQARGWLTDGVIDAQASREISSVIMGYCHLGLVEARSGEPELALAHADQALADVDESNERFHLPAAAHLARAIAFTDLGRPADAELALGEAQRVCDLSDEPLLAASIAVQRAQLCYAVGNRVDAREALRDAKQLVADLPDHRLDDLIRKTDNAIRFAPKPESNGTLVEGLTDREQAVLALLPYDLSRRELASQLHVSENTVKTHLTSIRHKIGVSGRESIVDRARELGLLVEE